jgi:diguanylate cyclase (GGDEF)-like protein
VLLIDLDHFKKVNDTHGHLAGDFVLQEASRRLKDTVRAYDSIGRYGGEEFLVIVPGSADGELCELAERLRKAIEKDPVRVGEHEIRITLSVGAAIAPAGENQRTDLVACADGALYEAKELGRNRSVFADRQLKQALPIRSLERTQLHCTSATRA